MTGPLLVLGAGEDQLPLYREARRRGIPTIGVDQRADRPARPWADRYVQVSTRDAGGIAAAVGPGPLAGVVSSASDACMESWLELATAYGCAFRPAETAVAASVDKAAFHRVVAGTGLPTYAHARSADPAELVRAAGALGYPLVVKPVDASGSRGVALVDTPADLPGAVSAACRLSFSGEAIAEEYVTGRHLTVEIFMRGGRPHFVPITEKVLVPGPNFLIGGHRCPAELAPGERERVAGAAARLCGALGITDGPANFDVVLTPDGTPYVLEVGARLCGNGYPRLLGLTYGVDTVAALLSLVLGEPFALAPRTPRPAILHVLASPLDVPGTLAGTAPLDRVAALPGVVDVELFVAPGERVLPFTQSAHKIGYLLVDGERPGQVRRRLADAVAALRLQVMPEAGVMVGSSPRRGGRGGLD